MQEFQKIIILHDGGRMVGAAYIYIYKAMALAILGVDS